MSQKIALETRNLSRSFFKIDSNVEKFIRWNDDDDDASNECSENDHANRYWSEKFESSDDMYENWKFESKSLMKFSKNDDQRNVSHICVSISNQTSWTKLLIDWFAEIWFIDCRIWNLDSMRDLSKKM